jgi:hypothetical protein
MTGLAKIDPTVLSARVSRAHRPWSATATSTAVTGEKYHAITGASGNASGGTVSSNNGITPFR